jgi:hypothetical protein
MFDLNHDWATKTIMPKRGPDLTICLTLPQHTLNEECLSNRALTPSYAACRSTILYLQAPVILGVQLHSNGRTFIFA